MVEGNSGFTPRYNHLMAPVSKTEIFFFGGVNGGYQSGDVLVLQIAQVGSGTGTFRTLRSGENAPDQFSTTGNQFNNLSDGKNGVGLVQD